MSFILSHMFMSQLAQSRIWLRSVFPQRHVNEAHLCSAADGDWPSTWSPRSSTEDPVSRWSRIRHTRQHLTAPCVPLHDCLHSKSWRCFSEWAVSAAGEKIQKRLFPPQQLPIYYRIDFKVHSSVLHCALNSAASALVPQSCVCSWLLFLLIPRFYLLMRLLFLPTSSTLVHHFLFLRQYSLWCHHFTARRIPQTHLPAHPEKEADMEGG